MNFYDPHYIGMLTKRAYPFARALSFAPSLYRGALDGVGGKQYWKYQIPGYGNVLRATESAKYVSDIQKNTGRSVKYPGLVYNNAGKNVFTDAVSLSGPIGRSVKYL